MKLFRIFDELCGRFQRAAFFHEVCHNHAKRKSTRLFKLIVEKEPSMFFRPFIKVDWFKLWKQHRES